MKKILVIEDNYEILENLVEFLELSGYEILSAENGKAGIAMAIELNPDLIICDVLMPGLSGHEVLLKLSERPSFNTPFIFSTSKSEPPDLVECMKLGANDLIIKPYLPEDLLLKIKSCFQSMGVEEENNKLHNYGNQSIS